MPARLRPPAVLLALAGAASAWSGEPARADAAPASFDNMATLVGDILDAHYYDRRAFRPQLMVERALRALAEAEPAILATWRDGKLWLRFGAASLDKPIDARTPTSLAEAMEIIERVRQAVGDAAERAAHPEAAGGAPILALGSAKRRRELDYALLNGALQTLDPHTGILPPEAAQEFSEDIQGEFFGIGAILREEEGQVMIERVLPGLPAERAGIEDGDAILAIDGEKTAGLALPQAVRRIKGPKGTTVRLTIDRKGAKAPFELPIVRNLITPITERAARIGDIGYVRMDEFHARTAQRLFEKVVELQRAGPIRAFVLDLRFNGGGLLDQARLVADMFLGGNLEIVRTVGADGPPTRLMSTAPELLEAPMAVLVSPSTASAAEIVSGSLQLHRRAAVIGAPTFGKGSVQSIRTLPDESRLKLTIQEYQLPGGASIQRTGVVPDLLLIGRSQAKDGAVDLQPFSGHREADDEFALLGHDTYQVKPSLSLAWLERPEEREAARRHAIAARDFAPDQEASLALDLLQAAMASPDWDAAAAQAHATGTLAPFLRDRLREPVAARSERESAALAQALAAAPRPIAWGERTAVGAGDISVRYLGPDELVPGRTAELRFAIDNRGSATAGRLWGLIEADRRSALWEEELIIGEIPPGGSAEAVLPFAVPPRLSGGAASAPASERCALVVRADGADAPLARLPLSFSVAAQPRPHLSYAWRLEDRTGAAKPAFAPDEQVFLRLSVINDGEAATAGPVEVAVFKDNDPFVAIEDSRRRTPAAIDPGARVDLDPIRVTVRSSIRRGPGRDERFQGREIKLQLRMFERLAEGVRDGRGRAELFHALVLPLASASAGQVMVQPALAMERIARTGDRAQLVLRASDDNLRFLALFQGRDKIDLQTGSALLDAAPGAEMAVRIPGLPAPVLRTYRWTANVALKPGLNELRFLASDESGLDETLDLRLWSDAPAVAGTGADVKAVVP